MSRRRSKIENSSLELLLDTMCNTFGGVMFIAISILVIISMMTNDIPRENKKPADMAALQQEILTLQEIYYELLQEHKLKEEQIKFTETDNSREKLRELIILEQFIKTMTLKIEKIKQTEIELNKSLITSEKMIKDQKQQIVIQESSLKKVQRELLTVQKKLAKLQKEEEKIPQLAFRVMEKSDLIPFFVMLHGNMFYPIGPWKADGDQDEIDKAVKIKTYMYKNTQVIACSINPQAGAAVFSGEVFSRQFQELLKKIPPGRAPKFFITPGSAATAFKMREIMKNHNIYHGTILAPADDTPCMLTYSPNAEYEY